MKNPSTPALPRRFATAGSVISPLTRHRVTAAPVALVFGSDHSLCGHFKEIVVGRLEDELGANPARPPGG
jgi:F0F1-type ATP synthase gamma subunit